MHFANKCKIAFGNLFSGPFFGLTVAYQSPKHFFKGAVVKWNLKKIKNLLFLPLCLILLNSYAQDGETAAPMGTPPNFTTHCRLADPIEGGSFEFEWNPSNVNNRLSFDVIKKLIRVSSTGPTHPGPAMGYAFIPPGGVGSYGSLGFKDFRLFFAVIPFGTIRGETGQYLIGTLNEGEVRRGIYLCAISLKDELKD